MNSRHRGFGALEDKLDLWLVDGAERFRNDPDLRESLLSVAKHPDSRRCLRLLEMILENPGLADRLFEVLSAGAPEHRATEKHTL